MISEEFLYLCERGNSRQIKEALAAGFSPNTHDEYGNSALLNAISYNNACIVRLLLQAGADANAQIGNKFDSTVETALQCALREGNLEVVSALLGSGADVNARDEEGMTPLHQSFSNIYGPEAVALLLQAGADVHARDKWGKTPLMYSFDTAAITLLLEAGSDINARDYTGRTALMYAIATNNSEAAALLLKAGA